MNNNIITASKCHVSRLQICLVYLSLQMSLQVENLDLVKKWGGRGRSCGWEKGVCMKLYYNVMVGVPSAGRSMVNTLYGYLAPSNLT